MVTSQKKLKQLRKIADLRFENQVRKFSSLGKHMAKALEQQQHERENLRQSYDSAAPLTAAEARAASHQAALAAFRLQRITADIERIRPHYETARRLALTELGRAAVLGKVTKG